MKKIINSLTAITSLAIVLSGCTKNAVNKLTDDESRIYITHRDSSVNFSAFHTFSISDSVAVIKNNQLKEKDQSPFDAQFISALSNAMEQRGYTLVDKSDHPDLAINVSRIYNDYTGVIDYGNYWNDYYGYWDPYYWGYPGYSYYFPVTYGVYSITEGGISVDMFDLKDAAESNKLENIWNGLIRGEGIFDSGNIKTQVNALFNQSAYIRAN